MKVSEQCGIAAAKGKYLCGLIPRNIVYKEKELILPMCKTLVMPYLEYCIQAYHKKDTDMLESLQRMYFLFHALSQWRRYHDTKYDTILVLQLVAVA